MYSNEKNLKRIKKLLSGFNSYSSPSNFNIDDLISDTESDFFNQIGGVVNDVASYSLESLPKDLLIGNILNETSLKKNGNVDNDDINSFFSNINKISENQNELDLEILKGKIKVILFPNCALLFSESESESEFQVFYFIKINNSRYYFYNTITFKKIIYNEDDTNKLNDSVDNIFDTAFDKIIEFKKKNEMDVDFNLENFIVELAKEDKTNSKYKYFMSESEKLEDLLKIESLNPNFKKFLNQKFINLNTELETSESNEYKDFMNDRKKKKEIDIKINELIEDLTKEDIIENIKYYLKESIENDNDLTNKNIYEIKNLLKKNRIQRLVLLLKANGKKDKVINGYENKDVYQKLIEIDNSLTTTLEEIIKIVKGNIAKYEIPKKEDNELIKFFIINIVANIIDKIKNSKELFNNKIDLETVIFFIENILYLMSIQEIDLNLPYELINFLLKFNNILKIYNLNNIAIIKEQSDEFINKFKIDGNITTVLEGEIDTSVQIKNDLEYIGNSKKYNNDFPNNLKSLIGDSEVNVEEIYPIGEFMDLEYNDGFDLKVINEYFKKNAKNLIQKEESVSVEQRQVPDDDEDDEDD